MIIFLASDLIFEKLVELQKYEEAKSIGMIVLDPIVSLMKQGSSMNNAQDIRELLDPLKTFAEKNQISIIGVNHMKKGDSFHYTDRALGSGAWTQAVRHALFVESDKNRTHILDFRNALN